MVLSGPAAFAGSFTFSTASGATTGGLPVNATADFITGPGFVGLTLTNNQANPTSVVQNISDIFFSLSGVTTGNLDSSSGTERNVASNGTFTDGSTVATGWSLTTGTTFHLNVLGTPTGPSHLIIGPPDGSNVYSNANGSIAGNGPHNPFLALNATFLITDAAITANTVVSNVVFSFGTTAGENNVPGIPGTPDNGSTLTLLGLGLGVCELLRRTLRNRLAFAKLG